MNEELPSSADVFARAQKVLPGGVSSPVRAFRAVGGQPLVIERARGAEIETVDGRRLLDFVGSWGPLILGHAHPAIVRVIAEASQRGTTFGAPCRAEVALAEKVVYCYPGMQKVRFVSSGTEATMSAIRLARGFTGRDLVVKYSGCYHGHADHLLVAAGSGLATFGHPSSAGVPQAFADKTLVLPLDDRLALDNLFREQGSDIAAVIIEPVPANNGLLLQRRDYLEHLRLLTREQGTMLIFDEVISGFRLGPGGAAQRYGILPDLATFGKVIGGGLPVGAYGGREEIMALLAPDGPVYQAGTLSGNPVAMAAGLKTLEILEQDNGWSRLDEMGKFFQEQMEPVLAAAKEPVSLVRFGSLFWLNLQEGPPPRSAEGIDPKAAERFEGVFSGLLERDIAIAPSAYEVGFISLAHTREQILQFVGALSEVL